MDRLVTVQKLTAEQMTQLRKLEWTGDEATFKRLLDAKPTSDVGRLHRFLYLTHFSYGKMSGRSFSPNVQGIEAQTIARIERDQPRLKGVKVYSGDYQKVVEKYDGHDTVRFLDSLAGDLWADHRDAIHAYRDAHRARPTPRSRRPNRPEDQISTDRDDR